MSVHRVAMCAAAAGLGRNLSVDRIMRPEEIDQHWQQIDRELEDIADLKVCTTDPVAREGELLEELDELEYEPGLNYFRERSK